MSVLILDAEPVVRANETVARQRPKANLDFLRAVAVLFVVFDHTCFALGIRQIGSWNPGWLGMLGVFIFFVHTTLVLMWSLERRPHVLDFYIRRVFRIYPLALLAIAVAVLTHAPTAGPPDHFFGRPAQTPISILTHCLLIQNLRPATPPLVNVMWTLPLEVQMYIVLPVLFAFGRQTRHIWPLVMIWCLVMAFGRVTFPDINTVNLVTVVPMFVPGVMAYIAFRRRKAVLPTWLYCLFLVAITSLFMRNPSNRYGSYVALGLGLGLPFFREITASYLVRPSHYVAQYSYGIYLSHPFGLVLGMYVLRGHSVWLQLAVEISTIAIASVVTYHFLELPMIRLGGRVAQRAETFYELHAGLSA